MTFLKGHTFWLGKKRSKADRLKMSIAHSKLEGEKTSRWLGNKVGYSALHDWVYRKLGSPMKCEICGKIKKNNYQIHWANKSGK